MKDTTTYTNGSTEPKLELAIIGLYDSQLPPLFKDMWQHWRVALPCKFIHTKLLKGLTGPSLMPAETTF